MAILMKGKDYQLFPKGWLNATIDSLEDKGEMSFKPGDDPKPKLVVHFKPEGAKNGATISVLCTNSRHPDATFRKICVAALDGYVPEIDEDVEALLVGKPLKVWNDHRVSSKDNLSYNRPKDFAPPDPAAAEQKAKPSTKRPGKSGRIKMAGGNGTDAQLLKSTEVDDEDAPY